LHDHGIHPAAELAADGFDHARTRETQAAVKFNRCRIPGIADDRDYLTVSFDFAAFEQILEQTPADALAPGLLST